MPRFAFCLSLLLMLPEGIAWGQPGAPIALPRLTSPIQFDGISDEPAWEAIAPFPLVALEPTFGQPPSERTEIRMAYDNTYIYASLRAYDSDSTGVRVKSLYRDRYNGDDLFGVYLDTFNDNENGVSFSTNPAGMRRDAAIASDANGPMNADYNTFWDSQTVVTPEGWFAEVRIPFSSLRFQDDDGRVVMGLVTFRTIARKFERVTFPELTASANMAYFKSSLAQKIVMEGIYAQKPLFVTPYALSGLNQSFGQPTLSPDRKAFSREIGLDLKYGLTSNLTADLTVNTDFAQVEADDQQVNLTRFSLFIPEKRQFFQERSAIFDFTTGTDGRLFHSRRIGLTDDGQPVRILGGARLNGRVGAWDVGFLDMQTAKDGALPSENFGVLRLRRQVLNPYSYAGGMATSRIGHDGSYNAAYGLDGVFRLFGDDFLSLVWAQTFDEGKAGLGTGRLSVDLERRRRQGLGYRSMFSWSGPGYDPGVGFSLRNDFTHAAQTLSHTWVPGLDSPFIWHALSVDGQVFLRNADQSVESADLGPSWNFSGKSGSGGSIEARLLHEDLLAPFSLSEDALVPAGRYLFQQVTAGYRMSRIRPFSSQVEATAGTFYDGWRVSMNLSPTWIASRHLELGGTYLFNRVRFPGRDQAFDGHLFRVRIGAALNTKVSANSFIQYNTSSHAASANVRFRYSFREGTDLWIVYNEGLNIDRHRLTPSLPFTQSRAVLLKYTHTFHL